MDVEEILEETTHAKIPFALRVFIVFASSVCAGAGFALVLWSLPLMTPQTAIEKIVADTQGTLKEAVPTPCAAHMPCMLTDQESSPETKGDDTEIPKETDVVSPIAADKHDLLAQPKALQKPAPKPAPRPAPKKVTTPKPVAKPKPQNPAQNTVFQKPVVAQAPAAPALAPKPTLLQVPVRQCTRTNNYALPGPITVDTANPGLKIVVDEPKYYTVYGNTATEIRRQMASCSPVQHGFDAVTNWWYRYSYNYYQKPNGLCAVKDVTIGLHISFLFPYWDSAGAPNALVTQWNRYYSSLKVHEFGHKDITISLAQDALQTLQNMPDQACEQIVQTINATADKKLNTIQRQNDEYDATTNHGGHQGAHFP
jgi:predicted secreted Zn-dependent protease